MPHHLRILSRKLAPLTKKDADAEKKEFKRIENLLWKNLSESESSCSDESFFLLKEYKPEFKHNKKAEY